MSKIIFASLGLVAGCVSPTTEPPARTSPLPRINWVAPYSSILAQNLRIETNGLVFTAPSNVDVGADYFDENHMTLETLWQEHGVQMRLNVAFAHDEHRWWIEDVAHYDGTAGPDQEWISYSAGYATSSLDETFEGDLDLATLHLRGARISAFAPPCEAGTEYTIEPAQLHITLLPPPYGYSAASFLRDADCNRIAIPDGMTMEWTLADPGIAIDRPEGPLEPFATRRAFSFLGAGQTTLAITLRDEAGVARATASIPFRATP